MNPTIMRIVFPEPGEDDQQMKPRHFRALPVSTSHSWNNIPTLTI